MSAEAEKVINLSLCKMAESRGIRRGGSSLHKHLLIASVLTKARSAYFENWYLGDNDCTSVNVNGDHLPSSAESSGTAGTDEDQLSLNQILDASFFVEVETEIELPSDILSCVEKLGDMSDMHLGFNVSGEVDLNSRIQNEEDMLGDSEDDQVTSTTTDMIQGDSEPDKMRNGAEITYTYLDLDVSKEATRSPTSVPVSANSLPSLFSNISPSPTPSQQSPSKRRRGWSFDQEDDSDDEDEEVEVPCSASPELQDKLKLKGRNVRHIAKRLRSSLSSSSANSTDVFDGSSGLASTTPLPPPSFSFEGKNHFRTKKSHFDVDEDESTHDASFLDGDGDDDDSWCGGSSKGKSSSDHNDQRVPSASSSSSDEEQETGSCSMEVDQITSLVQYFSFQKQQGNSVATGSVATTSVKTSLSSSSSAQLTSISRSMSSPDLCGRSGSNSSSSSGNSISCPTTKDLFSNYGLTSSHRILTMKV